MVHVVGLLLGWGILHPSVFLFPNTCIKEGQSNELVFYKQGYQIKTQDSQLNLNFRETTKVFSIKMEHTLNIICYSLKFKFNITSGIFPGSPNYSRDRIAEEEVFGASSSL